MYLNQGDPTMETSANIKVLDKALDILEIFSDDTPELSLSEIAKRTGMSTSTAFRIVKTLESRHFLHRHENKKFSLGVKFAYLGKIGIGTTWETLKDIALPYMHALRREVNESISIYVRDGDKRVCITRLESTDSLRQVIKLGDRYSLQEGATGKILLAYGDDKLQKAILLDSYQDKVEDFKKIRQSGYAISTGERAAGVSAIAVPILGKENMIIGSLSLSGPTYRLLDNNIQNKIQSAIKFGKEISKELSLQE